MASLTRGNHKSAVMDEARLCTDMAKEVQRGWQLPLPINAVWQLPGSVVAPIGVVHQASIDVQDQSVAKVHTTHNQSFNPVPGTQRSVNDRCVMSSLGPSTLHLSHRGTLSVAPARAYRAIKVCLEGSLLPITLRSISGSAGHSHSWWPCIRGIAVNFWPTQDAGVTLVKCCDMANVLVHYP